MSDFERVIAFIFVAWLIWFNQACNKKWVPIKSIVPKKFTLHPTKGAYGGSRAKSERIYIIAGGSGFLGSWIARYLLARGEVNVYILDIQAPAADLIKHGANYIPINLTHSVSLERELAKLSLLAGDDTKIVVYNCSITKKVSLPNFRADLGIQAAEMLFVALSIFEHHRVILIHVSDTFSHRLPIRNWDRVWPTKKLWCQESISDVDPNSNPMAESKEDRRDRSFNSYAWHQLQVENLTFQAMQYNSSIAAAAVLRVEGIVSGHLGDGVFSPVLQRGHAFIHSPETPITIVNVEDVARACLSLEHLLMDPSTSESVRGCQFTVGSDEVTSLREVFRYVKQRRPKMWTIPIPPALVFVATHIMSLVYTGKPSPRRSHSDSPLNLSLPNLTFARFYSLQVGQLPNPQNARRQRDVLFLRNNFSLSQTLDGLIDDIELSERIGRTSFVKRKNI